MFVELNDFYNLYKKFISGLKWFRLNYPEHPESKKRSEAFQREVIAPMECAWAKKKDEEKLKIIRGQK